MASAVGSVKTERIADGQAVKKVYHINKKPLYKNHREVFWKIYTFKTTRCLFHLCHSALEATFP